MDQTPSLDNRRYRYHPHRSRELKKNSGSTMSLYAYNTKSVQKYIPKNIEECIKADTKDKKVWLNISGRVEEEINSLQEHYKIHPLLIEDILSVDQRPKMDGMDGIIYCLLNMLSYDKKHGIITTEQVSVLLGKNLLISIQNKNRETDVFEPIREHLEIAESKERYKDTDYLLYTILDSIVDNYFVVMEEIADKIEKMENDIVADRTDHSLKDISHVRKELSLLQRNILPTRDLVNSLIRSESELIDRKTIKYFKDVYYHLIQLFDFSETYRELIITVQELYINSISLKTNQIMKIIAIVTCLLAPITVLSGVFGMNFDIPYLHAHDAFIITIVSMFAIIFTLIGIFKYYKWI